MAVSRVLRRRAGLPSPSGGEAEAHDNEALRLRPEYLKTHYGSAILFENKGGLARGAYAQIRRPEAA